MLKQSKSLQLRRRYLLLKADSREQVEKVILQGIGTMGYAKALPKFLDSTQLVLSIDRKMLNDIRACLELSKEQIKILKVSGTIKGLN